MKSKLPNASSQKIPAVTILEDIIAGVYGEDRKKIDNLLDVAFNELEAAGLEEQYDGLLHQAADVLTALLVKAAQELGDNISPEPHEIFDAIEEDSIDDVACIIEYGGANETTEGGWSPLHEAAKAGDIAITKMIIEHIQSGETDYGINSNYEFTDGSSLEQGTALSLALLHGHKDIARLLVEHGADVNASYYSEDQDTPEWFFGFRDLATNNGVCWWLADEELMEFMLEYNLDISASDSNECDALHHAIQSGDAKRLQWLLQHGANPNRKTYVEDYGDVSYLLAAALAATDTASEKRKARLYDVINILIEHGALLEPYCVDCGESPTEILLALNFDPMLDQIIGIKGVRETLRYSERAGKCEAIDITEKWRELSSAFPQEDLKELRIIAENKCLFLESRIRTKSVDLAETDIVRRVPFHGYDMKLSASRNFCYLDTEGIITTVLDCLAYDAHLCQILGLSTSNTFCKTTYLQTYLDHPHSFYLTRTGHRTNTIKSDITKALTILKNANFNVREDLHSAYLVWANSALWLEMTIGIDGNSTTDTATVMNVLPQFFAERGNAPLYSDLLPSGKIGAQFLEALEQDNRLADELSITDKGTLVWIEGHM